jgi:hypothetical protein
MKILFECFLFLFFLPVTGNSAGIIKDLDEYQIFTLSNRISTDLIPDNQGKILTLGLIKRTIDYLQSRYSIITFTPIDDDITAN